MRKRGHPPLNKNSAAATKLLQQQQMNGPPMERDERVVGEALLVAAVEDPSSSNSSPNTATAQLTAKNYRLAKELSEVRIRHREESKNVTRLTMENMNLASRCREAISQAAQMKKDLSLQRKKTAEAVAQTHVLLDQLKKHMQQRSSKTTEENHHPLPSSDDDDTVAKRTDASSNDTTLKSNAERVTTNGAKNAETMVETGEQGVLSAPRVESVTAEEQKASKEEATALPPPLLNVLPTEVEEPRSPAAAAVALDDVDPAEHVVPSLPRTILPSSPSDEKLDRPKVQAMENGATSPLRLPIMTEEPDDSEHKTDDPDALLLRTQPSEIEPSSNLVSSDDYESSEENDAGDVDVVEPILVEDDIADLPSSILRPVTPVATVESNVTAISDANPEGTSPTMESKEMTTSAWFDEDYDEAAGEAYDDTVVLGLSSPAKKEYFPHSASPKIHLRYPPAGANEHYEDEFPGDIVPPKIVHASSAKKKDHALAPLDEQWSSIDAFEASFQSPFSFEGSPTTSSNPFRFDEAPVESPTEESKSSRRLERNRGIRERATAVFRNHRRDTVARGAMNHHPTDTGTTSPLSPSDGSPSNYGRSSSQTNLPKSSPPLYKEGSPPKSTPPPTEKAADQSARWLQEIRASTEKKKFESPPEDRFIKELAVSPLYQVPGKSKDSDQPTPVFRQFPRSPQSLLPQNAMDPLRDSDATNTSSPVLLKQTNSPPESSRNTVSTARSRYVDAVSSERGRSRTLAVTTVPSSPTSPENGVNVRERAALYTKVSPASSSSTPPGGSNPWRPTSRSTVKLLDDDEGDIPMQTNLSPRKYRNEALSSEPIRVSAVSRRKEGEERYPGERGGRVQATIFDHDERWAEGGKQRRHINLSGSVPPRNGELPDDGRRQDEV